MLCHRHFPEQAERAGNEGMMSEEGERDERKEEQGGKWTTQAGQDGMVEAK